MAGTDEIASLIRAAAARAGSLGRLARELKERGHAGLSRPALSMRMSPRGYPAGTERIDARIRAALEAPVACPHLGRPIGRLECDEHRDRRMPKSDPEALRHWTACRSCAIGRDAAGAGRAGAE